MKTLAINSKLITKGHFRLDGGFYLNIHSFLSLYLEANEERCVKLEEIADVMNPPVFKRQFCSIKGNAVEYFQSSDVSLASNNSEVYIYRPQAEKIGAIVHEGNILVTGFGSIGNVRLVSKSQNNVCYANNVARIFPKGSVKTGFLYAFLMSKFGNAQLNKNASGSVVRYIEAPGIRKTLIPNLPETLQKKIDDLIQNASTLREEAAEILTKARKILKEKVHLRDLSPDDYDYFGPHPYYREVSCFVRKRKDIDTTTINAFNHSERIRNIKTLLKCNTKPLYEILLGGKTFSTGSFPRVETKKGYGVMLINQSDIFDTVIKGKYISKRNVNLSNLVEYGEVLIAGVGTLGENETFCRTIFANEDLVGQLVSGEFIRMKTTEEVPSGYLFAWLSSDYGFRLLRNTQTGTKLCRPIPSLVLQIPVPILDFKDMYEIDEMVRDAHTKQHIANNNEKEAISMIECEIENWNKENNKHDIGL